MSLKAISATIILLGWAGLTAAGGNLSAKVHLIKGNGYLHAHLYDRAIQSFSLAIELRPNYGEAYSRRGTAYFYNHANDLACLDWKQACTLELYCVGWNFGLNQKICTAEGAAISPTTKN